MNDDSPSVLFCPAIDPVVIDQKPDKSGISQLGVGGRGLESRQHMSAIKSMIVRSLTAAGGHLDRDFRISRCSDHSRISPHYRIIRVR